MTENSIDPPQVCGLAAAAACATVRGVSASPSFLQCVGMAMLSAGHFLLSGECRCWNICCHTNVSICLWPAQCNDNATGVEYLPWIAEDETHGELRQLDENAAQFMHCDKFAFHVHMRNELSDDDDFRNDIGNDWLLLWSSDRLELILFFFQKIFEFCAFFAILKMTKIVRARSSGASTVSQFEFSHTGGPNAKKGLTDNNKTKSKPTSPCILPFVLLVLLLLLTKTKSYCTYLATWLWDPSSRPTPTLGRANYLDCGIRTTGDFPPQKEATRMAQVSSINNNNTSWTIGQIVKVKPRTWAGYV